MKSHQCCLPGHDPSRVQPVRPGFPDNRLPPIASTLYTILTSSARIQRVMNRYLLPSRFQGRLDIQPVCDVKQK